MKDETVTVPVTYGPGRPRLAITVWGWAPGTAGIVPAVWIRAARRLGSALLPRTWARPPAARQPPTGLLTNVYPGLCSGRIRPCPRRAVPCQDPLRPAHQELIVREAQRVTESTRKPEHEVLTQTDVILTSFSLHPALGYGDVTRSLLVTLLEACSS